MLANLAMVLGCAYFQATDPALAARLASVPTVQEAERPPVQLREVFRDIRSAANSRSTGYLPLLRAIADYSSKSPRSALCAESLNAIYILGGDSEYFASLVKRGDPGLVYATALIVGREAHTKWHDMVSAQVSQSPALDTPLIAGALSEMAACIQLSVLLANCQTTDDAISLLAPHCLGDYTLEVGFTGDVFSDLSPTVQWSRHQLVLLSSRVPVDACVGLHNCDFAVFTQTGNPPPLPKKQEEIKNRLRAVVAGYFGQAAQEQWIRQGNAIVKRDEHFW